MQLADGMKWKMLSDKKAAQSWDDNQGAQIFFFLRMAAWQAVEEVEGDERGGAGAR